MLSQLCLPVLDMKRKNRDIVVEQAKILKFSKLANIGTNLRLFKLFFDNVLVDMIVDYTKLYCHRMKADTSFEITNETFHLLLDIVLLSEHYRLRDCSMH